MKFLHSWFCSSCIPSCHFIFNTPKYFIFSLFIFSLSLLASSKPQHFFLSRPQHSSLFFFFFYNFSLFSFHLLSMEIFVYFPPDSFNFWWWSFPLTDTLFYRVFAQPMSECNRSGSKFSPINMLYCLLFMIWSTCSCWWLIMNHHYCNNYLGSMVRVSDKSPQANTLRCYRVVLCTWHSSY